MIKNAFKKQHGQASMEFLLVSIILLFFIFFFINLAIVFMVSSYLDYTAFMAARTGMVSDRSTDDQKNNIRRVVASFVRTDANLNGSFPDAEDTFFSPFVRLLLQGGDQLQQIDDAPNPEFSANASAYFKQRVARIKLNFSHLFFLGSIFIPGLEGTERVDNAGVYHIFRRELSVDETRDVMGQILDQRFGSANVTSMDLEALTDNGY